MRNNLISGTDWPMRVYGNVFERNDGSAPSLRVGRNLIHDSRRSPFVSAIYGGLPGIRHEAEDLVADPRFVDPSRGDYRLAEDSPAIDAGLPRHTYVWTREGVDVGPPDRVDDVAPPLDGNADGRREGDVGAFEFRP